MRKQTPTKHSAQLNTQENAENNPNKNYPLAEREPITGTPFTLIHQSNIENTNDVWFMVMGDYRVTEPTEYKEEQIEKLESEKWLLIMHIAIIAVKKIQQQMELDYKESQKKETKPYETESL